MAVDLEVVALVDAAGTFPEPARQAFPNASEADWERAAAADPGAFGPADGWRLDFRCFAVRRPGGRVVLVDAGVGGPGSPAADWAPVPGRLPQALREAGIAAADVEAVVLTHLHNDHTGWAVGPDGAPFFPGARYVVQRAETAALAAEAAVQEHVVRPLRRAGVLQEVAGRHRLCPGVELLPTPGHTAGHQSVLVTAAGQETLLTGDVLVHAVQWVNPAVRYLYEDDPERARETREALLARAAARGQVLGTPHLTRAFVRAFVRP
ncbi:MBL fold metallo-hydrolase [Streptomyces bambusae]|uniref:MBL fold metallo-hydrolase n=1 Tax=Streptomyces bambusae TaxID=1550616 RepID=UPI001CFEE70C|nr:MBL fold metallo-hydrolase [Streptomyces bambusae]MCB5164224.1 MBL fold metallo-hydrolase [Streptomyces bambusae]